LACLRTLAAKARCGARNERSNGIPIERRRVVHFTKPLQRRRAVDQVQLCRAGGGEFQEVDRNRCRHDLAVQRNVARARARSRGAVAAPRRRSPASAAATTPAAASTTAHCYGNVPTGKRIIDIEEK
jgi:hypothetical protein